jgi:hypothetical protein
MARERLSGVDNLFFDTSKAKLYCKKERNRKPPLPKVDSFINIEAISLLFVREKSKGE